MTRREKLIDNYEDALFAVLMDKVAEEEGAKLREENQRLQNDPATEVPEHVDAVARQTIRKAFAGQNRRSALHVARRVLNAVAVLVLICSAVFVTAYAAFPEVRVKTLNLLIQSSDVASRLVLTKEDEGSSHSDVQDDAVILCGYLLPEIDGFSIVDQHSDKHGAWIRYESLNARIVRIEITNARTGYIDTEETDFVDEIIIHGYSGMMVAKGDRVTIAWSEEDRGYTIKIVSINITKDIVLSIAENIYYINS